MLFPNRVLRYEANYICTIILQRLRMESRFSGGGEPVSLPSASGTSAGWLAYSWFSAALSVLSITVIESVFCGVPRLPQPRGSVRPRVPVRGRLPGVDAAKAACWSTRDREARRLELTPGSDSVGTQSLTSLLTSMHVCVCTVIAHQCLLRPLLNCWLMFTICCSFLSAKKWLN